MTIANYQSHLYPNQNQSANIIIMILKLIVIYSILSPSLHFLSLLLLPELEKGMEYLSFCSDTEDSCRPYCECVKNKSIPSGDKSHQRCLYYNPSPTYQVVTTTFRSWCLPFFIIYYLYIDPSNL